MSRLLKSSRITIDKKKYVLSSDIFVPDEVEVVHHEEDEEEIKANLHDELTKMREDMLEEVKQESDAILNKAQNEFESVMNDAYNQSDTIKENARQEGYQDGFNKGAQDGYQEANGYIEEALGIKKKYYDHYDQLKHDSEEDITQVIINTVETVLHKHVEDDYELIKSLVEKALKKCGFTANLTLRVAPEDYDSAVSYKNYILSIAENVEDIDIKSDAALSKGSCVLDTDAGSIDSSVQTQYDMIKAKFLEVLQSE